MTIDIESIALRPATQDDSDFAYRLKKSALGEYVARVWGWDEDFQLDFHEREFKADGTNIIVLDGNDIGLLRVEREPDHIYIRHLYVLPKAQSQGIGSQIVKRIILEADGKRMPVRLHVLKVNSRAAEFYKRLGFRSLGETDTHFGMQTSP